MPSLRPALAPLLLATLCPSLAPAQGQPIDPDVSKAAGLVAKGEIDEGIALLERVLARDPGEGWAWYHWGYAHHKAGRLEEALRGHLISMMEEPPRSQLRARASYNAACVHALQGRHDHALQWIQRSRLAGFQNSAVLAGDTDFESLRDDPRFGVLAKSLAIGSVVGAKSSTIGGLRRGGTGGMACGPDGTIYISDFAARVWRERPGEKPELLASGFQRAAGSALEPDGSLLQVDFQAARVWRISPKGKKSDLGIEGLKSPVGVARAADGTLYLTDFNPRAVLRVPPGGKPEVIAAGGLLKGPNGICLAPTGDLYVCNYQNGAVLRVTQKGAVSFVAELPGGGNGHLLWHEGWLYVTSRRGHAVYRVTPEGAIEHLVGGGAQAHVDGVNRSAQHALPNGIALSPDGSTLYVNDQTLPRQFHVRAVHLPATK